MSDPAINNSPEAQDPQSPSSQDRSPENRGENPPSEAQAQTLAKRIRSLKTFWLGIAGFALALPALLLTFVPLYDEPLPEFAELPAFEFTDQDGELFSLEQAKGTVLIANFIFTRCPTVCPLLTRKMQDLQEKSLSLKPLHLVSFSVDPEHDTPGVLKEFGSRFGQNTQRWSMVTGDQAELEEVVVKGFKVGMERREIPGAEEDELDFDIVHGEHFVLVDQKGVIRGYYRSDEEGQARLLKDARRLVKVGP